MSRVLVNIIEGVALRMEDKPSIALFVDRLKKCDDIFLSILVDTLVFRLGFDIDKIDLQNSGVKVTLEEKSYVIDVKSVPVKSGKGYIAARTIHNVLKKHEKQGYILLTFVYPIPFVTSDDAEDTILESIKQYGTVYRRPVLIMGRRGIIYGITVSDGIGEGDVISVIETETYIASSKKMEVPQATKEKEKVDISIVQKPGLLYFRSTETSTDAIMDALHNEGAILSDLLKKRNDAVRVLGERGLSVVSTSDIATHRLFIADLNGGFTDFMAEVLRLKNEGLWDESVKNVVKMFIKEYENLGVSADVIKDILEKHDIDIAV